MPLWVNLILQVLNAVLPFIIENIPTTVTVSVAAAVGILAHHFNTNGTSQKVAYIPDSLSKKE